MSHLQILTSPAELSGLKQEQYILTKRIKLTKVNTLLTVNQLIEQLDEPDLAESVGKHVNERLVELTGYNLGSIPDWICETERELTPPAPRVEAPTNSEEVF